MSDRLPARIPHKMVNQWEQAAKNGDPQAQAKLKSLAKRYGFASWEAAQAQRVPKLPPDLALDASDKWIDELRKIDNPVMNGLLDVIDDTEMSVVKEKIVARMMATPSQLSDLRHDNVVRPLGRRPRNRAERGAAVDAWDSTPRDQRDQLEEWLEWYFGFDSTNPVLATTFQSWRKWKPKNLE